MAVCLWYELASFQVLSIDNVETATMLDDKILFLEEVKAMGLAVPEFHKIACINDVIDLCKKGERG